MEDKATGLRNHEQAHPCWYQQEDRTLNEELGTSIFYRLVWPFSSSFSSETTFIMLYNSPMRFNW
ncbi:MAG TPA: hypothetical protein VFP87_11570, partial [Chitinophagaceae bacterium]|nr:hypothetical protein [Chitinophagaceae bacterium]